MSVRHICAKGFWKCCDHLPLPVVSCLSRTLYGNNNVRAAGWHGRHGLSARMYVRSIKSKYGAAKSKNIILIGGPARVGKSRFAKRLSDRLGIPVVSTDKMMESYRTNKLRRGTYPKNDIFRRICSEASGLIIEGNELILYEYCRSGSSPTNHIVTASLMGSLVDGKRVVGVVVGCSEDTGDDKVDGIRANAEREFCWAANKLGEEEVMELARKVVSNSKKLDCEAREHGLIYVNLSSHSFEKDVEEAVERVLHVVRESG